MQVDPSQERERSREARWRRRQVALLPLAFGLLPAALQTACTVTAPAPSAQATEQTAQLPRHADPAVRDTLIRAEQGDVDAMVRLALLHETGSDGVAQDRTEMLHWLALASSLGSGRASYRLYLYYDGQPAGTARALRFKQTAARQGYYGPVGTHSSR